MELFGSKKCIAEVNFMNLIFVRVMLLTSRLPMCIMVSI